MALGELVFAFGRIVATAVAGDLKSILVNIATMEDPEEAPLEADVSEREPMYGLPGFYCRPLPPDDDAAVPGHCEVVSIRVGDELIPYGYRDLRINAKTNPASGELGLAHYGGGFISLKLSNNDDGTAIGIYAPRGTDGAHMISLDPDEDNSHVVLMHEAGQSVTLTKEGSVVLANAAGDAFIEVHSGGISLNGNSAITGALRELSVGNPVAAEGLMMSVGMLAWITQVTTFLAVLAPLVNAPVGPMNSLGPGSVVLPTAAPKASTIAKASEAAV